MRARRQPGGVKDKEWQVLLGSLPSRELASLLDSDCSLLHPTGEGAAWIAAGCADGRASLQRRKGSLKETRGLSFVPQLKGVSVADRAWPPVPMLSRVSRFRAIGETRHLPAQNYIAQLNLCS